VATNFVKKWQTRATFVALAFRHEMGYDYINVRTNSTNDASISYENFVKFGPATQELTELICERQVRHSQKCGAFSGISPDLLDRFSQSLHLMKALNVQMMDL